MRYLFAILALLIVSMAGAQTRAGHYSKVVYSTVARNVRSETTRLKIPRGSIHIGRKYIIIDSASTRGRQAYSIIKRTDVMDYDFDDSSAAAGIQFFRAVQITKDGTYLVLGYILFRDDKQHITDLVFMPSAGKEITYTFNKED